MIIAERKPIDEIIGMLSDHKNILVLGCGTCVTVCSAGGEKEVGVLASELRIKSKIDNLEQGFDEDTIERQCENEFVETLKNKVNKYDAILSMGCGVGVQTIAGMFPDAVVLPALNTTFMGMPESQGNWAEYCRGCGDCVLHLTAGICPIARCSKNILNGPCGGTTSDGKCEVNKDIDCAWYLIYQRLKDQGKLDLMKEIRPPKDWRPAGYGGPRRVIREDLIPEDESEVEKEGGK